MSKYYHFLFALVFISLSSCVPVLNNAPIVTGDGGWTVVPAVNAESPIVTLHATPYELYAITNTHFFRLDLNTELVEKISINRDTRPFFGSPVTSDNTFVQIIQNTDNNQVLNFQMVRNSSNIKKIVINEVLSPGENFTVESSPHVQGAFNNDGTKYYLPGILSAGSVSKEYVLIFNITLNSSGTDFIAIQLSQKVPIPGLATLGKVVSSKYVGGSFYLATQDGGFRITPDGIVTKIFNSWALDFFSKGSKFYSTGFNSSDFLQSSDGSTWTHSSTPSPLKLVKSAGDYLFSTSLPTWGSRFQVSDSTMTQAKELVYNSDFTAAQLVYYDVEFFHNNYYLVVDKQLYTTPKLKLK